MSTIIGLVSTFRLPLQNNSPKTAHILPQMIITYKYALWVVSGRKMGYNLSLAYEKNKRYPIRIVPNISLHVHNSKALEK